MIFPKWTVVYTLILAISSITTILASWSLVKSLKGVESCVLHATFWYFVSKSTYSVARMALMGCFLHEYTLPHSSWFNTSSTMLDVCGPRLFGAPGADFLAPDEVPWYVGVFLHIGDAALIAGAMWMLVLVIKLTRLAVRMFTSEGLMLNLLSYQNKTRSRSNALEVRQRKIYFGTILLIVALFYTVCSVVVRYTPQIMYMYVILVFLV
jgi:hypothetical protein